MPKTGIRIIEKTRKDPFCGAGNVFRPRVIFCPKKGGKSLNNPVKTGLIR